ncbi:hypothetical protein Hanom_Chr09g00790071 [Helianthus anomalus]
MTFFFSEKNETSKPMMVVPAGRCLPNPSPFVRSAHKNPSDLGLAASSVGNQHVFAIRADRDIVAGFTPMARNDKDVRRLK